MSFNFRDFYCIVSIILHLKLSDLIWYFYIQRNKYEAKYTYKGKGKVIFHPITGHECPELKRRRSSTLSLTSSIDGVGVNATARPLYTRERLGTLCLRGWVGPRAGLDRCGISSPPPGLDPRTVQPVASRYTDWDIPAHEIRVRNILYKISI